MPWFVEVNDDTRNRPSRLGPFVSEEEANLNKDAFVNSPRPNPVAGDPFELEAGDPAIEVPVPVSVNADKEGNETEVWSDGSTSARGES